MTTTEIRLTLPDVSRACLGCRRHLAWIAQATEHLSQDQVRECNEVALGQLKRAYEETKP